MKTKVEVMMHLGIRGDDMAIFHALEKLGEAYRERWLEAHQREADDDGDASGTFPISNIGEMVKIIAALKDVQPEYYLYLKTSGKDEGFEVTVWPERIWAEMYRDSDKILADSKEKIAAAIKLLGEI